MDVRKAQQGEFAVQSLAGVKPASERSLSYTQVSTWLACRKRWEYAYVVGITPHKSTYAMDLGTMVHDLMAQLFEHGEIVDIEATEDAMDTMEEAVSIALRAYAAFPDNFEVAVINGVKAVEIAIEVPLPGWQKFNGYLDLVVRDKETGAYWVVDYKVRKQLANDDAEAVNLQMSSYQHLLTENGYPTVGTIIYQILAQSPRVPKINQDGSVSRAKIKTDVATYKKAVEEAGGNEADYAEMLFKLADVELQRMSYQHRSDVEVANTWREIVVPVATEIAEYLELGEEAHYLRTWSKFACNFCAYRLPCSESLAGRDPSYTIATNFIGRKNRGE
jgi:CRISPR/Cas system-associated exonuclease Cas4 (RecB family)